MIKTIFKHLKTICKHKAIVCLECIKCGFIWRGLMHDNSKFGFAEFLPSAKYFQGNRSPIDAETDSIEYQLLQTVAVEVLNNIDRKDTGHDEQPPKQR